MSIERKELGRRLKAAREVCGLTQKEAAEHLDVSRPTLTQMELGKRTVTSTELQRLGYLYGRDIRSLLTDEPRGHEPVVALFRAHPEIREQDILLRAIRDCLEIGRELANVEHLLGMDRELVAATYPIGRPRNRWVAIEQGRRVAAEERRRLELGNVPIANVAQLLDHQGIHTAQVELPDDISGLTLLEPEVGALVVSNKTHSYERRRFSYAHEYAHVLLDRDRPGIISRTAARDDLIEVRANTFAANFLMPADGVQQMVRTLGKGHPSRMQADVFDEEEALEVRARSAPGSQDIQLYDVAQLAHHFGTSRLATIYRLRNLRLITEAQLEALRSQDLRHGDQVARLLGLPQPDNQRESNAFRHRFLILAIEAFRREEITRDKLYALADLALVEHADVDMLLDDMDLAPESGEDEPLLPEV